MANGIVLVSCLFLAYINYLFLDYNGCSYNKGLINVFQEGKFEEVRGHKAVKWCSVCNDVAIISMRGLGAW